jgi:hypothetical protein
LFILESTSTTYPKLSVISNPAQNPELDFAIKSPAEKQLPAIFVKNIAL